MEKTIKKATRKRVMLSYNELIIFSEEMKMMITGGISSLEGVTVLLEESEQEKEREWLLQLKAQMERTGSFAKAIEETKIFPSYYCKMVKIAEQTGKTEEVLDALSEHYQREYEISQMIKSAVSYPIFMGTIMFLILIVIIMKVLPVFSEVYQQLGSNMTGISAGLLAVGLWLNKFPIVLPLILLFHILLLWGLLGTKKGKKLMRKVAYRNKSVQEIADWVANSRFSAGLVLMLESGMGLNEAVEEAGQLTVGMPNVKKRVEQCQSALNNQYEVGTAVAEVFGGAYGKMTLFAAKTGNLEQALKKLTVMYQKDAEEKMQDKISTIEPSIVIFLSILVGIILLSVMLPLLGIMTGLH